MEKINFDKMEGLGNDYVYLTSLEHVPENLSELARDISDRHFGVGGDGLVMVTKSDVADFRMIMYNADGSEAQMCGNASRCIARLVYEKGLTSKTEFTLETKAGIKQLKLNLKNGSIESVSVNMGRPLLEEAEIPVNASTKKDRNIAIHTLSSEGESLEVYCVGMGNPHGIVYMDVDEERFQKLGPWLECHSIWPEKANIEFVKVKDDHNIEMRVWERGTGETLACGTGACASAVASILSGRTSNNVNVNMKGGNLNIRLNELGEVIMTGNSRHVASGIYFWKK